MSLLKKLYWYKKQKDQFKSRKRTFLTNRFDFFVFIYKLTEIIYNVTDTHILAVHIHLNISRAISAQITANSLFTGLLMCVEYVG